jgi:hypothetical protein
MPTIDYERANELAYEWGLPILYAVLILLAAHVVAKVVQWGLARLIDRAPGLKRHTAGVAPKETIGYQLGQLGYWLVLLIGVVGALSQLGLTSIVTPLNGLLYEVMAFLPNVIGAAIIFFVGLVVATLARRVVEAALVATHVDGFLERAGLSRMTGASGLSRTFGTLVFVLIIIPVTIAALQQLGVEAISGPAVAVLDIVLQAIPRVLAAAVIMAIAFVIGRWVAGLIEQVLPSFGFDRSLQALGLGTSTTPTPHLDDAEPPGSTSAATTSLTPSKVVARLALLAILMFSAVEAARLLAFAAVAVMLTEVLELAGHVLFGGVIITAGVLIGNFLAGLIDRSTNGADGFASDIVRWATIALATAMGLQFMGIADEIVILAFGLVLGSAAVAAALAFGIGGRETAGRLLEKWTRKAETRPPPAARKRPPQPPKYSGGKGPPRMPRA